MSSDTTNTAEKFNEDSREMIDSVCQSFFHEKVYRTDLGVILNADSRRVLDRIPDNSVDLVFTSPPFPLIRKKDYGNLGEDEYIDWFCEFASRVHRVLKPTGSFVVDLGSAWMPKRPVRSLYEMKLCIKLVEDLDFRLAQDFYWWNPSKLPTPAQWVTIKRTRVKDAINRVYWFSKTDNPKASNREVCQPYTENMVAYINRGKSEHHTRPSGHKPSSYFIKDNGGAIPPNLLAISNAGAAKYVKYCKANDITPHPARFPYDLPEFFIRMLTEPGDFVLDPFGGSCTTGSVAESLDRHWMNIEINKEYLFGALGHFQDGANPRNNVDYTIPKPRYVKK